MTMTSTIIVRARVTARPLAADDPPRMVYVTVAGQREQFLFMFDDADAQFTAGDFVGLTLTEARARAPARSEAST